MKNRGHTECRIAHPPKERLCPQDTQGTQVDPVQKKNPLCMELVLVSPGDKNCPQCKVYKRHLKSIQHQNYKFQHDKEWVHLQGSGNSGLSDMLVERIGHKENTKSLKYIVCTKPDQQHQH